MEHYYKKALDKKAICEDCKRELWIETTRAKITSNPTACQMMDFLNQEGYSFRHGKNGGEHFVNICAGYFLDGFDEKNGVIFEYDELLHSVRKAEDIQRQKDIFLFFRECEIMPINFFRFDESTDALYEVFNTGA